MSRRWAKHGASAGCAGQAGGGAAAVASKARSACGRARNWARPTPTWTFEELTDPQGINFWPEPIGPRQHPHADGLGRLAQRRVHHRQAVAAGEAAASWRAMSPRRQGVAGSVLESYRAMLAFRKGRAGAAGGRHAVPRPARAGAGLSWRGDGAVLCLFNLSPQAVSLTVSGVARAGRPVAGRGPVGRTA